MDPHEAYFKSLPREEEQLVILQAILYDGSWDEMEKDLVARSAGKPFVFKLQSRIEEDLERIQKLRKYERENEVRLSDYVSRE